MKRIFLILLLGLIFSVQLLAQAVRTEHVEAQLVPEVTAFEPGVAFWVGLHLKMKPHWHVYWRNAGDAGLPVSINWDLPEGFSAGEFQWPYPKRIPFGDFTDYGYEDEVLLPVKITPPANLPPGSTVTFRAAAEWLVCEEICVPENVDLQLQLTAAETAEINEPWVQAFSDTRARLPLTQSGWQVQVARQDSALSFHLTPPEWNSDSPGVISFFPYDELVIENGAPQPNAIANGAYQVLVALSPDRAGEPDSISGILVSENGWRGAGSERSMEVRLAIDQSGGTTIGDSGISSIGLALLFAFIGGMILNLMPCVLPVLSLKILGFVQQAGEDRRKIFVHGLIFTLGVLVSFWVLAGALLLLRAGGEQLGWGFQLQSPTFIIVLSVFMFLFGLNLFGVFEVGTSLMGVGQGSASRSDFIGSFVSGVTATVVATPCTAPFMGSALGFALSQPMWSSMAIFTFLGLGMAAPYVLLSSAPGLLKFVPKPGPWMDTLKQSMGFLLMATVIWLLYVLNGQIGSLGVFISLLALLVVSIAAWIYGRWGSLMRAQPVRLAARFSAILLILVSLWFTIQSISSYAVPVQGSAGNSSTADPGDPNWLPYSPQLVKDLRAQGKPVFIDFTATWCLSCQVNKKIALHNADVEAAFAQKGVTTIIADWTSKDDTITRALAEFGRNSVPLYVLYPPQPGAEPIILPELLTPGILLEALENIN